MGDLLKLSIPWWELALRSVAIYIVLLAGLRIFGKREVGQFTLFDLVFVLLVANAVQPAMTGPDSSLLGGVIVIFSLLAANFAVGRLDDIPFFHRLLTPKPAVLVRNGRMLDRVMRKEGVTPDDAEKPLAGGGSLLVASVPRTRTRRPGPPSGINAVLPVRGGAGTSRMGRSKQRDSFRNAI